MASLLYGLAGKLAGELCSPLLKTYVGKPWELGTKSEFEKLKSTVSAIEAVLLDAEEKERTNRQVRDWLIKIKLVFYDLEDLLQEVTTEALRRQVMTRRNGKAKKVFDFLSRSNPVTYRFKMGHKVKLIRERLDVIASDRNAFNFTEWREEMHVVRRREETHSFVPVDQFIGRETDKECVTKHLLQPHAVDNVSVVSVVGIRGLGKTSLVQSIYNSAEVKDKFDLSMWVCVSDPFDVQLICENILESATHNKCKRLQLDGVKDELKKAIDERKYLLVLDDVWNDKHIKWLELEVLLRGGATGSKILITTRSHLVAQAAKSSATHVLKGLSPEDSWALFKQVAFKRGVEQMSPTIEGIGKEVVEKCSGVPLVVKAIGSILAVKEGEIEWLDFKKNDLPRVTQDSEGSVLPILRLSYDYLSAPLKRCFVYCAIYPKDCEIEKEELIGMWMAHGLIQLDGTTRSLEDVGERHFMDLLDRSFIEVRKRALGEGTYYKMHDLIHDLAQSIGGDEYYNPGLGTNYVDRSTRHAWVSMHENPSFCEGDKLRTLVRTRSGDEQKLDELMCTFEQLRVLRLKLVSSMSVPNYVGGLRHLYYLDLSWSEFVSLPESICCLYNLQTLILYFCWKLEELPAGTRDLVSLRQLDIRQCNNLRTMPPGLEELTCLQKLSNFVIGEGRNCVEVCELKSLVNLRGLLEIKYLKATKCAKCKRNKSCILIKLELIKQLELKWWYGRRRIEVEEEEELLLIESLKPHPNLEELTIQSYPGKKLPSWMDRSVNIRISLPNIVSIHLESCKNWRHFPPLGLLPSLQELHLWDMDRIEYLIDTSTLEEEPDQLLFPSLKELYLICMPELTSLVELAESSRTAATNNRCFPVLEKLKINRCPLFLAGDGRKEDWKQFVSLLEVSLECTETLPSWIQHLPNLQTLELLFCENIVSLPEWMSNLTSLQRLLIEPVGRKLISRYEKETGADWHKIKHIPNINLVKSFNFDYSSSEGEE